MGKENFKMQDITVFCGDSCSDPHRYVRYTLQCEQAGYGAVLCICSLLN